MSILNFILMNIDSVLLVLAIIVTVVILYARGYKKLLYYFLFVAVTEAERQYKSGTGILKKASVIAKIYGVLPFILKIIITEDKLGQMIEDALTYAKEKWAENAAIGDYVKQEDTAEAVIDKPPDEIENDFYGGKYII